METHSYLWVLGGDEPIRARLNKNRQMKVKRNVSTERIKMLNTLSMKLFSVLAASLVIGGSLITATPEAKAASCERLADLAEEAAGKFNVARAQGNEDDQAKYYVRSQSYIKQAQKQGCMN